MSAAPLRVGFVMTNEVGLRTHHLNWRESLAQLGPAAVAPEWIVIDWWREGGLVERLPLLPPALKSRLRAYHEFSFGFRKGPFDAVYLAADLLPGQDRLIRRQPYFFVLDATWKQLYDFGDLYQKEPSRFPWRERERLRRRTALIRNARGLFPWSRWAAESLVRDYGADPDRIRVIPPGVDLRKWQAPPRPARSETQLLFVGGDFSRKGGELLLEWARHSARRDWHLHLVTRDPIPHLPGRITVHSNLEANDPRLRRLYQEADVFVLPTRADCYSLATIEAMAAGLPVILSQVGGTGEILSDGDTGFLIQPGDQQALGERLELLIGNPDLRRRMGGAARAEAERRFDMRRNAEQALAYIRTAVTSG